MRLTYKSAVDAAVNEQNNIRTIIPSSNIMVRVAYGSDMAILSKIALYNRLYVSGWMLSHYLQEIISGKWQSRDVGQVSCMALVYLDGVPVNVTLMHRTGELNSFTRKAQRNKGIGKLAIKHIDGLCNDRFGILIAYGHCNGIYGCYTFFNKSLSGSRNVA